MPEGFIVYYHLYNIMDWYWLADDGRIFSSAKRTTVSSNDPDYTNFIVNAMPTPWPRDDNGDQTDQALQDVFAAADIQPPVQPPINVSSRKR